MARSVKRRENETFEKMFKRFKSRVEKSGHWRDVLEKSHLARWGRRRGLISKRK